MWIILGILIIVTVAIGCYFILQASNEVDSKLELIPNTNDHLISYNTLSKEQFEKYTIMNILSLKKIITLITELLRAYF